MRSAKFWRMGQFALALLAATVAPAHALVVQGSSSYSVYVAGQVSGAGTLLTGTFDGVAQNFTRSNLDLTLNEMQTDLGGGRHLISISLTANGDLFPTSGEAGYTGIGVGGNGLDFLRPLHLEDGRISFSSDTATSTTANLADDYRNTHFQDPWTGLFPASNIVFSYGNIGGRGIDSVVFNFTVSEIPEPGTLAIMALGLAGLAFSRRRQR